VFWIFTLRPHVPLREARVACASSNADNPDCCCYCAAVWLLQVGFVAQLSKGASRAVVADALKMLARMSHRGACGCEENTGESDVCAAVCDGGRGAAKRRG
jgi:hypothetical protein